MQNRIEAAVALLDESALLLSGRGQRVLAAELDQIAERIESGPTLEFGLPQGPLQVAASDTMVVQQFPADAVLPYDCFMSGERPLPSEPPFGERQDCRAEEALALLQQGLQVFRLDPATNQFCRLTLPLPEPEAVTAALQSIRCTVFPVGNQWYLTIDGLKNQPQMAPFVSAVAIGPFATKQEANKFAFSIPETVPTLSTKNEEETYPATLALVKRAVAPEDFRAQYGTRGVEARRVRAGDEPDGQTLVLRIDSLDNDAFAEDPGQEIARIVRRAAARVKQNDGDFRLSDGNGNRVGSVSLDGPSDGAALVITIDLANAAFGGGGWGRECARILTKAAGRLESGTIHDFKLMDVNGNGVGRCVTAGTVAAGPAGVDKALAIMTAADAKLSVYDSGPEDGPACRVNSKLGTTQFSNNPSQYVEVELQRGTTEVARVLLGVSPYPSWDKNRLAQEPRLLEAANKITQACVGKFGPPDTWSQKLATATTEDEIADPLGSPALIVITEDPQVGALDADYFRTEGVAYFVLEQQRLTGEAIYAKIAEAQPDEVLDLVCCGRPPEVGQDVLTACGLEQIKAEDGTVWREVSAADVQALLATDTNATGHEQTAAESLARRLTGTTAPVVRPVTAAAEEITRVDLLNLYRVELTPGEIDRVYALLRDERGSPEKRLAAIDNIINAKGVKRITAPDSGRMLDLIGVPDRLDSGASSVGIGYDSEDGFVITSAQEWLAERAAEDGAGAAVTAATKITLADLTELYRKHVSPEEIQQVYDILQGSSGPLGRLAQINDIVGGHGVEGVSAPGDRENYSHTAHTLSYINEGDAYTATLGYDSEDGFVITSYGDWLEGLEHSFHDENPPSYGVGVMVEFDEEYGDDGSTYEKVVDELLSKTAAKEADNWGDPWDARQKFVFEYTSQEEAKSEAVKVEDQIKSAAGAAGVKLASLWVGPVTLHHYQTSEEMDEAQQYGRHGSGFFQPAGDDQYDGHQTAWVEASAAVVTAARRAKRKPKRRAKARKRVRASLADVTEAALEQLFPALRNWRCVELVENDSPTDAADAAVAALPAPAGIDPKALKAWKDIGRNDCFAVFPEPQTEDVLAVLQQHGIEDPVVRPGAYFVEYMCSHYGYNYGRTIMTLVNFMAQQHGVESLRIRGDAVYGNYPNLFYINVGDTYAPTLLCDQDHRTECFSIGSWGDWQEQQEQDFAKRHPTRWGVGIDFLVSESANATEDDGMQIEEALDAALGRDSQQLGDSIGQPYEWEYQGVLETHSRSDAEAKATALLPRLTEEAKQRGVTYSRLVMVPVQLRSFMDQDQHYDEVKAAKQQRRFCIDIGKQEPSSDWEYWAAWIQI